MFRITILLLLLFASCGAVAQKKIEMSYEDFEHLYDHYSENDSTALPAVAQHMKKAKKENNIRELLYALENGLYYSPRREDKLRYADMALHEALRSGNPDHITRAYLGKGIVYYYNYKQFKPALDAYLQAHHYSKSSRNQYLQNKVLYHLGVVKSYLGFYEEALDHFNICLLFFESKLTEDEQHPTARFNHRKGLLNTLHQLAVCYEHLGQRTKADEMISAGLQNIGSEKAFLEEQGYLLKSRGISYFRAGQYDAALRDFTRSNILLRAPEDFAWIAVNNFYAGRCYLQTGKPDLALPYFIKNDSTFNVHHFIHPEIRPQYEYLIDYYKKEGQPEKELYYTQQLLKADQYLAGDFKHLTTHLHKSYDNQRLLEDQARLIQQQHHSLGVIIFLAAGSIALILFLVIQRRRSRHIVKQYRKLMENLKTSDDLYQFSPGETAIPEKKQEVSEKTVAQLLEKLKTFEDKEMFTSNKVTLAWTAQKLGTNSSHLSYVVNKHKGMSFSQYVKHLRIRYITHLLYKDAKYRRYTISSLAEECGIASRQTFSKQFQEVNDISPIDYIKQLNAEQPVKG